MFIKYNSLHAEGENGKYTVSNNMSETMSQSENIATKTLHFIGHYIKYRNDTLTNDEHYLHIIKPLHAILKIIS